MDDRVRAKEQRMRRGIMSSVRGLREQREHAMDEYATALVDIHAFKERAEQARQRARELKLEARRMGNTAAELKSVEELVESQWKATMADTKNSEPVEDADTDADTSLATVDDDATGVSVDSDADGQDDQDTNTLTDDAVMLGEDTDMDTDMSVVQGSSVWGDR